MTLYKGLVGISTGRLHTNFRLVIPLVSVGTNVSRGNLDFICNVYSYKTLRQILYNINTCFIEVLGMWVPCYFPFQKCLKYFMIINLKRQCKQLKEIHYTFEKREQFQVSKFIWPDCM